MGNKLSAEEPQHVKTLKSKPNVLEEPGLQYYTAGWREGEFDDDAEEFSFATCKETPGYDDDDEQETKTDHGAGWHASKDDFANLRIRRGRLEARSPSHQDCTRKERKCSPSEARCIQVKDGESASNGRNGGRNTASAIAIHEEKKCYGP